MTMRLLHIIASMDPLTGGPCQGIRNMNRIFEGLNIHREVVSLDDPNAPFIGTDTFVIHALGPSKTAWQYSEKLLPWLLENLGRFDTVVVNGIWLYHVYAVRKALGILRRKNVSFKDNPEKIPKLFIMPHGMLDPYFQKASGRKLKAFRNWIYWKLIEGKNIQNANGLFFTCEVELQLARQNFSSYKPKKEINVSYGVEDVPKYNEKMKAAFLEKCPDVNEASYFLFLSRIHFKKGVDMLVKAYVKIFNARKVGGKMNDFPKLVIAGPGMETHYGKSLEQLIVKFPELRSFILFPGMLTGDAKWGALYGCEAFILPSHQENFGIAVVEALACQKPVLISNQINIWHEIIACEGGIVKDDTLKGTEELLESWMNLSQEQKALLSQNARNSFEKKFSVFPAAMRFIEALNSN